VERGHAQPPIPPRISEFRLLEARVARSVSARSARVMAASRSLVWLNDTGVPLSATNGFVVEPVKVSLTSAHATPPVTYHNQPELAQPSRARNVPIELSLAESVREVDAPTPPRFCAALEEVFC
jgi:hypothetical protein